MAWINPHHYGDVAQSLMPHKRILRGPRLEHRDLKTYLGAA